LTSSAGSWGSRSAPRSTPSSRVDALETLLAERGLITKEDWAEATVSAEEKWETGAMIDSLINPDVRQLLEELRQRFGGSIFAARAS